MVRGPREVLRFEVDPDTSGLWEQVKGDLHRRLKDKQFNPGALRLVSRIYIEFARKDPGGLGRIITAIQLEDKGYQP